MSSWWSRNAGIRQQRRSNSAFHRIFQSMGHLISCKANSLALNLFKMELDEEVIKEVQERESSAVENVKWDGGSWEGV